MQKLSQICTAHSASLNRVFFSETGAALLPLLPQTYTIVISNYCYFIYLQRVRLFAVVAVALRRQRKLHEAELDAFLAGAAKLEAAVRFRGVRTRKHRRHDEAALGRVGREYDVAVGHCGKIARKLR